MKVIKNHRIRIGGGYCLSFKAYGKFTLHIVHITTYINEAFCTAVFDLPAFTSILILVTQQIHDMRRTFSHTAYRERVWLSG